MTNTYCASNWHSGTAARGGFGMPTFGGLVASAIAADLGARERIAVVATQAPKRTPGTQVWSPPT